MGEQKSFRETVSRLLETSGHPDLGTLLDEERDLGVSYQSIAKRLGKLTNGACVVSSTTVRNWHKKELLEKQGAAA